MMESKTYANFDGMVWPLPNDDLEYRLRYAGYPGKDFIFSMEDRLVAASILAAYGQLISISEKQRNFIVKLIREAIK